MKNINTLNRELLNTKNDEVKELATKYILRDAANINAGTVERRIKYITSHADVDEQNQLILSEDEAFDLEQLRKQLGAFQQRANALSEVLKDFEETLTAKDKRILHLIAYANTDELDKDNHRAIRFGGYGEKREELFAGYDRLEKAMELAEIALSESGLKETKEYKDALRTAAKALIIWLNNNYTVDNDSPIEAYHSAVFNNQKVPVHTSNPKIVSYMLTWGAMKDTAQWDGALNRRFNRNDFWTSLSNWFYVNMTKGSSTFKYTRPDLGDDVKLAAMKLDKNYEYAGQVTTKATAAEASKEASKTAKNAEKTAKNVAEKEVK